MEVMLEVVSVSREDELRSLRAAREIGVDWVLGGTHAERRRRDPRRRRPLLPVPGHDRRPPERARRARSTRSPRDAARLTALDGVHGLDLLAYRHATEDPIALTRAVAAAADGPVIAAGSVASLRADRGAGGRGRVGLHDRQRDLRRRSFPGAPDRRPARSRRCCAPMSTRHARGRRWSTRCARACSRTSSSGKLAPGDKLPERGRDRRALRRQPRDRPRGRARPARGRLPDAPPRLRHLRDQGAAQPPRAGHDRLLHRDDPRGRPRAGRDRDQQGRARARPSTSASCSTSPATSRCSSSSACASPTAAR